MWLRHSFFFLNLTGGGARLGWAPRSGRLETGGDRHRAPGGGGGHPAGMLGPGARPPASGHYRVTPMRPEGQERYLRLDPTARRSPYRRSRILARHQLVTKIQQGEWPRSRAVPDSDGPWLISCSPAVPSIVRALPAVGFCATLHGALRSKLG